MSLEYRTVTGTELSAFSSALADLRIRVFREYPYLYDGSLAYEQAYLETYTASDQAMAVLVLDTASTSVTGAEAEHVTVVGASTGIPMAQESDEFRQPLAVAGFPSDSLFYFGESVLLPDYRGRGVYRQFFERRERYVRELIEKGAKFTHLCFCAVDRPERHPLRPADYQPLDRIWQHFGYRKLQGPVMHFDWKDIDQPEETSHPMSYWIKAV